MVIPTAPWAHIFFDLVAWGSAAVLALLVGRWRLAPAVARVAGQTGPGYFVAVAAGALPGAWLAGSVNTLREAAATLSHSVAGALAGAIVTVELYKWARGIRGSTGVVFVAPFTLGVVVGRFGCLFAGLPDQTYGVPTTLPWGVDLGDGVLRHPVQLYESGAMAAFLALYLRALGRGDGWVGQAFYVMAGFYGLQRFFWEFLKPYPPVLGPFNVFHLICLGLMGYGFAFYRRSQPAPA